MSFLNKKTVSIIAALCVSAVAVGGLSMHANAAMKVKTFTVSKGSLIKNAEINGNVVSDRIQSDYADIDGKIQKVHVKEGDFVKKGDLLISYDTEEIDRMIALTGYSVQEAMGGYDNVIQSGGRSAGLYQEAKTTLAQLDEQIALTQAVIDINQNALLERRAALASEGAKLQVSLIDWADKPDSDEFENLQKLAAENEYAQQSDSKIVKLQEDINLLTAQLAGYKEKRAEMVSQKATGYAGILTKGTKEQIEASRNAKELSSSELIARYEEAKEGIRADFDGVVTKIGVCEGESVGKGALLLTVESAEDVVIKMSVNKYDIMEMEVGQPAEMTMKNKKYTGKVSRIEHMTGSDESSNVNVEVRLDEPDENIILGFETKVKVNTASLEDAMVVPLDALGLDGESEYVFVLDDKKAVKKFVQTGIRNDDDAQILSGIEPGDTVIWNDDTDLEDGMEVRFE